MAFWPLRLIMAADSYSPQQLLATCIGLGHNPTTISLSKLVAWSLSVVLFDMNGDPPTSIATTSDTSTEAMLPPPPCELPRLTYGACHFMDYLRASEQRNEDLVLQIADIAKLKYGDGYKKDLQYGIHLPYTVYRFLLSDGSHLAPARMSIERVIIPSQLIYINDIDIRIKTGEIRKGSFVKVNPTISYAHKGMLILSKIEVLGHGPWDDLIRSHGDNELVPVHDFVMQFSPISKHHCTCDLQDDPLVDDPIPFEVLQFASVCRRKYGYCEIAGGSCLDKDLYSFKGCRFCYPVEAEKLLRNRASSDVDLWVPLSPLAFARSQSASASVVSYRPSFDLSEALRELYECFGIYHTPVITKIRQNFHPYEDRGQYTWMELILGLKQIHEFNLVRRDGTVVKKPVQVMVIDALAKHEAQTWSELILRSFDMDIIRCRPDITNEPQSILAPSPAISQILYLDGCQPLVTAQYNYTVRPCVLFCRIYKRLRKYRQRGFTMASLSFDEDCTPEWIEYIKTSFGILCFPRNILDMEKETGIHLPADVHTKIKSYLRDPCDELSKRLDLRKRLRDIIIRKLAGDNDRGPNGRTVDVRSLRRAWKVSDRALQRRMSVQQYYTGRHYLSDTTESDSDDTDDDQSLPDLIMVD